MFKTCINTKTRPVIYLECRKRFRDSLSTIDKHSIPHQNNTNTSFPSNGSILRVIAYS